MKYVLEYKHRDFATKARMVFKENTDGNETLIWVISPTGKKELKTKRSARERWNAMVKQGWRRVE